MAAGSISTFEWGKYVVSVAADGCRLGGRGFLSRRPLARSGDV